MRADLKGRLFEMLTSRQEQFTQLLASAVLRPDDPVLVDSERQLMLQHTKRKCGSLISTRLEQEAVENNSN